MKAQPWNCLVVTFTNRAAKEMKERVYNLIGEMANSVWLGTFHSICVKILRQHAELIGLKSNFTILGEDDQKRLIKQILENCLCYSRVTIYWIVFCGSTSQLNRK
jgi:DNA helicase-2/ATP-dependent DNA helicase PcrA